MGGRKKRNILSRRFDCPGCGTTVRIPLLWMTGIESVLRCGGCKACFGTGYKAGAVLFALALVLAVTTVNLICYLAGPRLMMVWFFAAIPLWFFYGFILRKAWMLRRGRKNVPKAG